MTQTEALRLALKALETSMYPQQKQLQAITAIKAALEEKDEPEQMAKLGWQVIDCPICGGGARAFPKQEAKDEPEYYGLTKDHLWMSISKEHYDRLKPEFRMACYTTPLQLKPLTEIALLGAYEEEQQGRWGDHVRGLRAIEAAHGITGDNNG